MVKNEYLKPAGRPLQLRPKKVLKKTKGGTYIQSYYPDNEGLFTHYVFGPRAPRGYQETLNPKYFPPLPFLKNR